MVQICEGERTKNDMLTENVEKYKDMFIRTKQQFARITEVCQSFYSNMISLTDTYPQERWEPDTKQRNPL